MGKRENREDGEKGKKGKQGKMGKGPIFDSEPFDSICQRAK